MLIAFCTCFLANIYEARNRLLDVTEPKIIADIPATYYIPNHPSFTESVKQMHPSCGSPMSPVINSPMSPVWPYNFPNFNHSPFIGLLPQQQVMYNVMHGSMASSGYEQMLFLLFYASEW